MLIIFFFLFGACSILQNGYTNQYGHYIPKKPKFKLKDKQGVFPIGLDTINVYKMVEMYNNDNLIYPKALLTNEERYSYVKELNESNQYIKFYPNGRCLMFTVPIKDSLVGSLNSIKSTNLNPQIAKKSYYYSPDGINIQIESFVRGDGKGYYIITNYVLDEDKLIMQDKYIKIIYERVIIPDF